MSRTIQGMFTTPAGRRGCSFPSVVLAAAALCTLLSGCAALTNPIADGLPVRRLPPELLASHPKDEERSIALDLLGQPASKVYLLAPGDVLGVWVDGVLGDKAVIPPISTPPATLLGGGQRRLPPAFGYPIPVREDGTLNLPLVGRVPVAGLSVAQAEDSIREAYLKKQILPAGRERVIVTLAHPREHTVVVLRQESGSIALEPQGGLGGGKRGTGHVIDLMAYENDVLHALALTGGLPGLDAYDEVVIFRGCFHGSADSVLLLEQLKKLPANENALKAAGLGRQIIRIPLRQLPGEHLPIRPEDVVLQTGDVVFVEARDQDLFYTGGLLPSGEFVLPRDSDLDVVQAVLRIKGPLVNGGFATNNLSGTIIQPGLGAPSPSLLIVLRKTAGGGQVPIRVDLNRAARDRRERILVRAGDTLILQEQPSEALTRYFTQTFFNFNLVWTPLHTSNAVGSVNIAAPDRINSIGASTTSTLTP